MRQFSLLYLSKILHFVIVSIEFILFWIKNVKNIQNRLGINTMGIHKSYFEHEWGGKLSSKTWVIKEQKFSEGCGIWAKVMETAWTPHLCCNKFYFYLFFGTLLHQSCFKVCLLGFYNIPYAITLIFVLLGLIRERKGKSCM